MYIHIDHNSGVPITQQIVEQIKYMTISGSLKENEKIPSVRGLATELKLNPTTVARVYRQLEAEGIIYTQRGRGSFISSRRGGLTDEEKKLRMGGSIRKLVVEAGRLELDSEDLLELVREEIETLHGSSKDGDEKNPPENREETS